MREALPKVLWGTAIGIALALLLAVSFLLADLRFGRNARQRQTYSAYVRDKSIKILETRHGTQVIHLLTVETLHGARFQVEVNEAIYRQAQPGAFIEKGASDSQPTLSP